MTFLLSSLATIGFFFLLRYFGRWRTEGIAAFWSREASALGLLLNRSMFQNRIYGTVNGWPVRVETFERNEDQWLRVMVLGRGCIPDGIELKREGAFSGLKKAVLGQDILTGDKEFDDAVNVSGMEAAAVAFLGNRARRAVSKLVSAGGGVRDGAFYLERKFVREQGAITDPVRLLTALASWLPDAGAVADRLAANAGEDPLPDVRIRNLRVLAGEFRADGKTMQTVEASLSDRDPSVRLTAAELAGGALGREAIRRLLEDGGVADAIRAAAVHVALANGDRALLGPILALVPKHDPGLAEAVAVALGQLGDWQCENALLRLLVREAVEVRRAAAEALGRIGSIRAVEPLLEVVRTGGGAAAARDAVRRIQSRIEGAERGGLSLAASEARTGALSVAPEGGELSVTPDPKRTKE